MASRLLHAIVDWSRSRLQVRTKYHKATSHDTTELYTLAAHSREDTIFDASNSVSSVRLQQAAPEGSNEPVPIGRFLRYRRRLSGWKFGILQFATWASIVFTINLSITIWGSVSYKKVGSLLLEGDCERVKRLNSGLHILINILSTILLSGSNYCMQCLSAPTRIEIDKAHASQRWLDIGIPSVRNLRYISRRRLALWLLLGASSVPLHLL